MLNNKKKSLGFTIIELLVVVAVIGLLSSIVLVSVKTARENAIEKKSMQFSASIYHSLGAYALGIWHFDGDYNDSSGNDIYTEWMEAVYVDGIINQAVDLEDSEDLMYIPTTEKLKNKSGQATVEFWVKISGSSVTGGLITAENVEYWNYPIECYISNQQIRCYMEDLDYNYISFRKDFQPGKWLHIVLTYSGEGTAQMFFNGEEVPIYSGGAFYDEFSTEADIFIGDWGGGVEAYMDEFKIYDSYINLSEVKKYYAQGLMRIGLAEYNNHSL
jgi:prepilin-type N-terminal cleavage/methylation domain-containing protein